jgi:hypothetical protein
LKSAEKKPKQKYTPRMTKPNPNAMPRAQYARLGGYAIAAKLGSDGMRKMGARAKDANVKGGKVQGKANAASGFLDSIRTQAGSRRGGVKQNHLRWHIARGKPNPRRCELCQQELEQEAVNPARGNATREQS